MSTLILCLFFILVLHPRHKLAYFTSAGWEDNWIKTAEHHLVHDRFESDYHQIEMVTVDAGPSTTCASDTEEVCNLVIVIVFLLIASGALGSLIVRKYIRPPSITCPPQIHHSGR